MEKVGLFVWKFYLPRLEPATFYETIIY